MARNTLLWSLVATVAALSTPPVTRRNLLQQTMAATTLFTPFSAMAAADCYADCVKNCRLIAPKDPQYCDAECRDYCSQDDRKDGLSGSVSAEAGEVGILGGTFGTGTVVKGEDRPPSITIPGLDFTSAQGKKLIGY